MKTLWTLLLLSSSIFAQDAIKYQQGKIDMHGGKFDSYNTMNGYKGGGFRNSASNLSHFLDKNTSKKTLEKKPPPKQH